MHSNKNNNTQLNIQGHLSNYACVRGFPMVPMVPLAANGTIGLPMVPMVPLEEPMVPLALSLVPTVLPMVPLVEP